MRFEVKLPDLGDDAADEATVSFFYPEVDDPIREGDDLVEMLTDKATFNVPAPVSGRLVEVVAKENDTLKAGQLLAVIETEN